MAQEYDWDVIVIGYGMAGVSAAIEAAERGASVLVLDRSHGGGASALSGGVVYAGGGTPTQVEDGVKDTVENMYNYLHQEVDGVVSDETLRRFCEQSPEMIQWLETHGAVFAGGTPPYKTSYPTDDYYLYYSGNEQAYPYNTKAEPAPRGHRQVAKGLGSGKKLMEALMRSAEEAGVRFLPAAHVDDLVREEDRVVGVRYRVMPKSHPKFKLHETMIKSTAKLGTWFPGPVKAMSKLADKVWEGASYRGELRAKAVIIAAGGFVYNDEWLAKYAPEFTDIQALGTAGDDGTGIRLGMDAGGTVDHMDRVTAWRFLSPPADFLKGIAVGMSGERMVNEDVYGARLGNFMMREHDGEGWAVYDRNHWMGAFKGLFSETLSFQFAQILAVMTVGFKMSWSLERLAKRMGVDPDGLARTVDAYNRGIESGEGDPLGKSESYSWPVKDAPFFAYNISAKNAIWYPLPGLTLGGLVLNEETGQVVRADGSAIEGLYAAGRSAVGVASNTYVSGLSLADCVFSGRRAAVHATSPAALTSR